MKHFPEIFGTVIALFVCTAMARYLNSKADEWGLFGLILVCASIVAFCLLVARSWDKRQAIERDQDRA